LERRAVSAAPFVAFFLSGASSLVFQTLWARMLQHVFGSTSVAVSTVLTVFMAGLGLGAWISGRFADRIRRPLLFYALAEVAIGLCGLVIPHLVDAEGWLAEVNALLRRELGAGSAGFLMVRFFCVVPILIVPTILMGSTLPLLTRHFVVAEDRAAAMSSRAGTLYAVNTFGAVAGTLLAGFVLLPTVGLRWTNLAAVGMNFFLAALVIASLPWLRRELPGRSIAPAADPVAVPDAWTRRLALAGFAASGAAALCYEVVWTRALAMTIGSSVYSFALILMTFLAGIAGGSATASALLERVRTPLGGLAVAAALLALLAHAPLIPSWGLGGWLSAWGATLLCLGLVGVFARRANAPRAEGTWGGAALLAVPVLAGAIHLATAQDDLSRIAFSVTSAVSSFLLLHLMLRRRPLVLLALCQVYIGAATFLSYAWQDEIPATFARLVASLTDLPDHVGTLQFLMFLTAALCTLPATLGMGAMFPLTLRACGRGGASVGRDVAAVYTVNTAGAIAGAWLPGFLLLPSIGMEGALHLGIALNVLVGLTLLWRSGAPLRSRAVLTAAIAGLAAAGWLATLGPGARLRWDLSQMTLGVFRVWRAPEIAGAPPEEGPDIVYYKDGLSTTVSVERFGPLLSMKNNAKVEASNSGDMPQQILVAAYPLLWHGRGPADLDVAIIGLGSGVTAGAALRFPVRSVEVVELESAVVEASRFFQEVNHLSYGLSEFPYIQTPRLTIVHDDGRNALASTDRQYDVIVSEPSNPWITGVSDLFTTDYYRIAKRRLRDGGIFCQWIQLYELSPENIKVLLRTFALHFRYLLVLAPWRLSSDTIVLGSDSPLPLDFARLERAFGVPAVAKELKRAGVTSPYDPLALVLFADRAEVLRFAEVELRRRNGRWEAVPDGDNAGPCPAPDCRRESVPVNTDDNGLIEFAAPRDLIGYERFAGYLERLYASDWPYGRTPGRVVGIGEGATAARHLAELGLALYARGRRDEAVLQLERAHRSGRARELAIAVETISRLAQARAPQAHPVDLAVMEALVVTDPSVARDHPEVLEALARAHDANGDPLEAVRMMRRSVEARSVAAGRR
jgi:predicted membrane-bound spermidine synthase